jgi:ribosomal protein S18 acetylase RimI-like enzyme
VLATLDRFAVRPATPRDAEGIGRVYVDSWRASYRGILPDAYLDQLDPRMRAALHHRNLTDGEDLHLVAFDTTHGDIVGFCDAGQSRRGGPWRSEIYTLYLLAHAKRHGLGRELFERARRDLDGESLIIWVLEKNHHARRFYDALGGTLGGRFQSRIGGATVIEQAYVWDRY